MVTVPKPPGSRQLISPPAAVFEIAPAKVLHGAVRLQGLTSSPTPDTHVLVACAEADAGIASPISARAGRSLRVRLCGNISASLNPLPVVAQETPLVGGGPVHVAGAPTSGRLDPQDADRAPAAGRESS